VSRELTKHVAIVWQDIGNDLTEGPKGPWFEPPHPGTYNWTTRTLPTIQYQPYMALNARVPNERSNSQASKLQTFPQSASLMSVNYGRSLDRELMSCNAFYALTELFTFTAFSEIQFLNMIEAKIKQEAEFTIISNLLYNKKVIDQHVNNIGETLLFIKLYEGHDLNVLSSRSAAMQEKVLASTKKLLRDFEYLHDRAKQLSASCDRGMNIVMNNNMLLESQRAIQQAEGVAKPTRLAFFYIPLFYGLFFWHEFQTARNGNIGYLGVVHCVFTRFSSFNSLSRIRHGRMDERIV
jgi:hypothetical protein